MKDITNKAKEYFDSIQSKLPYVKKLQEEFEDLYIEDVNALYDEIENLNQLAEDYRDEVVRLREELEKARNPIKYGQPGYPKEDHDLSFLREGGDSIYGARSNDPVDDDDSKFEVSDKPFKLLHHNYNGKYTPIITLNQTSEKPVEQVLEIDPKKLRKIFGESADIWKEFNDTRLGEAKIIEQSRIGIQAWAISNRNRVEAETERRVPISLYSQMEPKSVTRITNKRVLGNEPEEPHIIFEPLPKDVDYALVKRYDNNRMKIEYYDENDVLLNPSIEDKDLLVKQLTWWERFQNWLNQE